MKVKTIVLKVSMMCLKCKTCVMKAVAKLEGINSMAVDSEKGTLTVVGTVDPVLIVKQLRKMGKAVVIDSVGEKKEEKPPTKVEDKDKDNKPHLPPCCPACQPIGFVASYYSEPNWPCTIL